MSGRLKAIHYRHLKVHENNTNPVKSNLLNLLNCLCTILCNNNRRAIASQSSRKNPDINFIIFKFGLDDYLKILVSVLKCFLQTEMYFSFP